MSRVCAKVNFTRDVVPKCVVDTSMERCENAEHIKGMDFVFLHLQCKLAGDITFDPILVKQR